MMITEFSVKNYKCYGDATYFELPGLTFVSGTNNSGKSSFLQAIYLLTQNKSNRYPVLSLNEELQLGNFSNILNRNSSNREAIEISVTFDVSNDDNLSYLSCYFMYKNPSEYNQLTIYDIEDYPLLDMLEINYQEKNTTKVQTIEFKLMDLKNNFLYQVSSESDNGFCHIHHLVPEQIIYNALDMNERKMCSPLYEVICRFLYKLTTDNIHYLKALRLNDFIDKNKSLDATLGLSGEFTAEIMHKKWNHKVDFEVNGKNLLFRELFSIWVKTLLGEEYEVKTQKVDREKYRILITDIYSQLDFTLDQVGFGISQMLPILTMLFSSKKQDIILIENPEVHLHPKLQALFVDLCVEVLKNDRKLIIETHSEHMINRLRLNIKKNPQLIKNVNVYFFEKLHNETIATNVEISKEGKLAYWPKNFFDQSYIDLMGLISND